MTLLEIERAYRNVRKVLEPMTKTTAGSKADIEAARLAMQSLYLLRLQARGKFQGEPEQ